MATMTLSIFALLVFIQTAYGSGVQLNANPKVIQTILTQDMEMTCSFNDTTGGDIRFVTSLVITRNGQEVASITPFSPVYAHDNSGKMNASGSVSTQNGAQGYLTLKWSYPDSGQSGNYTCEVNGVNSVGHPIKYTSDVSIPVRQPTLADITLHVRDQQIEINKQNVQNLQLQFANADHETAIQNLQMDMKAQKEGLDKQTAQNIIINSQLDQILTNIDEARHVETGNLVFGRSDAAPWKDVGNYMERNLTATFKNAYEKTPVIHLSPVHVVSYNLNGNLHYSLKYWLDVLQVNTTEFTVRARAEGVSQTYLYFTQFDIDWISIGKPE